MLVKTVLTAEPRHRGMSLLGFERDPGFQVARRLKKLGYKGIDTGELIFEDCRVPADRLIGVRGAWTAANSWGSRAGSY
ncbi:MAG: hypothetical protein CM1200mP41_36160 [Gammaproteobacteria bacterium]|nr:MAG: hypothetical protein CM1200mP41_36160 [Gammaproteobacteria bacterium]